MQSRRPTPLAKPPTDLDVARLYAEQFPRVFTFALRLLGDESDAADAAQETFAAISASPGAFRGESAPLTWALSITKRICARRLRGRGRLTFGEIAALIDAEARSPSSPHSQLERRAYVTDVKEGCLAGLLRCLPVSQRCVFVLHLLNGFSIPEVGRILRKRPNAIRVLLSRARASMRAFLCANCSLVTPGAKCSCENMIEFSGCAAGSSARWTSGGALARSQPSSGPSPTRWSCTGPCPSPKPRSLAPSRAAGTERSRESEMNRGEAPPRG